MKVLLVAPRFPARDRTQALLPPLGLAYLAGALRREGHEPALLDLNLFGSGAEGHRALSRAVVELEPNVVGLSALTSTLREAFALATVVRTLRPATATVLGGVGPTIDPAGALAHPAVDFVVHGEGEETLPELLERWQPGGSPGATGEPFAGLAWRVNGECRVGPRRPPIQDLDLLAPPAYDLLAFERYFSPQASGGRLAAMFTSRGCPHRCIFCDAHVVHHRGWRAQSAERVAAEMAVLREKFGVREIIFKDSEFTLDPRRLEALCSSLLERGPRLTWSCNGRVGSLRLSLLRTMRAAGCRLIQFGVESGDQQVLDTLEKGITTGEIEETFQLARKAGIRTVANLMVGNPGETWDSLRRTLALARRIQPDYVNVNFLIPFPGTRLHALALERGWMREQRDEMNREVPTMNATALTDAELASALAFVRRGFYLRPRYILSRMLTLSPSEWRKNLVGMAGVLGLQDCSHPN